MRVSSQTVPAVSPAAFPLVLPIPEKALPTDDAGKVALLTRLLLDSPEASETTYDLSLSKIVKVLFPGQVIPDDPLPDWWVPLDGSPAGQLNLMRQMLVFMRHERGEKNPVVLALSILGVLFPEEFECETRCIKPEAFEVFNSRGRREIRTI